MCSHCICSHTVPYYKPSTGRQIPLHCTLPCLHKLLLASEHQSHLLAHPDYQKWFACQLHPDEWCRKTQQHCLTNTDHAVHVRVNTQLNSPEISFHHLPKIGCVYSHNWLHKLNHHHMAASAWGSKKTHTLTVYWSQYNVINSILGAPITGWHTCTLYSTSHQLFVLPQYKQPSHSYIAITDPARVLKTTV